MVLFLGLLISIKMKVEKYLMIFVFLSLFVNLVFAQGIDIGKQYGFDNPGDLYVENTHYPRVLPDGEHIETIIAGENAKIVYVKDGKKRTFTNLKKGSWFKFEGGELVEASFGASEDTEYEIENIKFKAPKKSVVDLKDGLITVTVNPGSKIEKPSKIDSDKEAGVVIRYVIKKDSEEGLDMGGGFYFNKLTDSEEGVLFFDSEVGLFKIEKGRINNLEIGNWGEGENKYDNPTYILFNEEDIDKIGDEPYIYISKDKRKFQIGSPEGKSSASVGFLNGDKIGGIEVDSKNDLFIVVSEKGKSVVTIEDQGDEKVSLITANGEYKILAGKHLPYYDEEKGMPRVMIPKTGKEIDNTSPNFRLITKDSEGNDIMIKYDIKGKEVEVRAVDLFFSKAGYEASRDEEEIEMLSQESYQELGLRSKAKVRTLSKHSIESQRKFLGGKTVWEVLQGNPSEVMEVLEDVDESKIQLPGGGSVSVSRGDGKDSWIKTRTDAGLKKYIEEEVYAKGILSKNHLKIDNQKGPLIFYEGEWKKVYGRYLVENRKLRIYHSFGSGHQFRYYEYLGEKWVLQK